MPKKTRNKKLNNESHRFGVLLEHMDSKFDLVLEGHKALDRKMDKHHEEFKEFRGEIDYKFNIVFEKLDGIDDELRLIRDELKNKVGRDEFLTLEKRVIFLERKLASHR